MGVGAAWANIISRTEGIIAGSSSRHGRRGLSPGDSLQQGRELCQCINITHGGCDGGWSGDSSDWSRSRRSDGRCGGKRLIPCSASRQRGTWGSGDSGLLLWQARRERDTRLLRDVIVFVFLDDDRIKYGSLFVLTCLQVFCTML